MDIQMHIRMIYIGSTQRAILRRATSVSESAMLCMSVCELVGE